MSEKNMITTGRIYPALLKFTVPFLLSSLLQNLYGTVDLLVIGNYSNAASVSAVATGSQVMSLLTFLMMGFSMGATVLIGRYIGAQQYKKVADVIGNSVILFTGMSMVLAGVLIILHGTFLNWMNIPVEAVTEANTYTLICAFGIPLIVGYNTVCSILRGIGDSQRPLYFVAVACVVNIVLDYLLAGVFHMGAAGVAIATVVAQGVSFIVGLIYIMKRGLGFEFSREDITFDFETTKSIFTISVPLAIRSIMINFSFMLITAIINKMGVTVSAAMGVGDKIVNFAFIPQSSFSSAIAIFVAQNMGAEQPDRAIKSTLYGMGTCVGIGVIFCIFSHIYPTVLPSIFTKDVAVQQMCGEYIRAYSYDAILTSIVFCLTSMFNGCGKSGFTVIQDLVSTFLMRVPFTYFMSKMSGVTLFQLGLAAPAASFVSIVICVIYLKSGKWKTLSGE